MVHKYDITGFSPKPIDIDWRVPVMRVEGGDKAYWEAHEKRMKAGAVKAWCGTTHCVRRGWCGTPPHRISKRLGWCGTPPPADTEENRKLEAYTAQYVKDHQGWK